MSLLHNNLNLDENLLRALHSAVDLSKREVARLVKTSGLSLTQYAVLEALLTEEDLSVGEIQKRIFGTPGNVPFVINNLQTKGLVERKGKPEDRRCSQVSLSVRGKQLVVALKPRRDAIIKSLFERFSEADKQTLLSLLQLLIKQ